MADVFISYSKQEPQPTKSLATTLRARGYTVWWDAEMLSGEDFRKVVVKELAEARAVIVIWTQSSVKSDWVVSEAQRARGMRKLVPVRVREIEHSDIPPPFDVLHTDYWDEYDRIVSALEAMKVLPTRAESSLARSATAVGRPRTAEEEASDKMMQGLLAVVRETTGGGARAGHEPASVPASRRKADDFHYVEDEPMPIPATWRKPQRLATESWSWAKLGWALLASICAAAFLAFLIYRLPTTWG